MLVSHAQAHADPRNLDYNVILERTEKWHHRYEQKFEKVI